MKTTVTLSKKSQATSGSDLPRKITKALRAVLPSGGKNYPLHEPQFSGREWEYVKDCIDTRMVSSVGSYVDRFERMLEEYTGAKHAVAVVNGTAGLHVALRLAGVIPGDEVLVPALTFVATANAVIYCGAIPHFVDSEEKTLGLDAGKLKEHLRTQTVQRDGVCVNQKTGRIIRALLPMHAFGHPADIERLADVAREFGLALVEDAAESLGSFYRGSHTGTLGLLGVVSFNGNKILTTGGGGAILTNSPELAKRAKHLTTVAKVPHAWDYRHDEVGYNYRLPNLNASLGCAQMEQLPGILAAKRALHQRYLTAFQGLDGVRLIEEAENRRSNYWLETALLDRGLEKNLEPILEKLHEEKIFARPAWSPLHLLAPYKHFPRMDLASVESLSKRIFNLPSSPALGAGIVA
jgi:aminotransferase in exopolysaccharide biosynthesis